MLDDYRMQTPGRLGVWDNLIGVQNIVEADYLLIQDECPDLELIQNFSPDKILYVSREATVNYLKRENTKGYLVFSFWDNSGYLPVRWAYKSESDSANSGSVYSGVELDYDQLSKLEVPNKKFLLCSVLSNKSDTKGHRIRKKFVQDFMRENEIDVYGSASFANKKFIGGSKFETLLKYKYCLAFDNQDNLSDFVGTQFTDAILAWTVPIFWGGADLSKYYPKGSYLQFDARNRRSKREIAEFLKRDDFSSRLPALFEARELLLNQYNLWPTIKRVLDSENS
jgi:hypothetical protein